MLYTIEKNFEPSEAMVVKMGWRTERSQNKTVLQGCDSNPLDGFLLETCEKAELLERETKTAYKQEPEATYHLA